MGDRRAQGVRGATMVEYVMLIALVSIVAMTATKALGATASNQFSAAAAQLASPDPGSAATPTPVDDGSGTADTTAPTTPPTSPPTTVPPTTVPPTTLPPVATNGSTELTAPTVTSYGSYWWATSELVVTDNLGVPLSGARVTLTVKSYTRQSNGTYAWVTTTQTLTTDSDGAVGFYVGIYYGGSSTGSVTKATVEVSAVTLPNGLAWDGNPSTITINSP